MVKHNFIKVIKESVHKSYKNIAYIMAFAVLIWFVMYPEFSLTADCVRVVDENGEAVECELSDKELALAVLEADEDEIVIKSRFLEWITQWSENINAEECDN